MPGQVARISSRETPRAAGSRSRAASDVAAHLFGDSGERTDPGHGHSVAATRRGRRDYGAKKACEM